MKKIFLALLVPVLILGSSVLGACGSKQFDYDKMSSPIKVEETYWYLEQDQDIPCYYLYMKAANVSEKDIKAAEAYLGFNLYWYYDDGKFGGEGGNPFSNIHKIELPIDGTWKAGEKQIFRLSIQKVEDVIYGKDAMIVNIAESAVMPYWVDYSGIGSWGENDFREFDSIVYNDYNFIEKFFTEIPDFKILNNS